MSMLGIAGFALMILIVALLLWGKSTPAVVFILLPIIDEQIDGKPAQNHPGGGHLGAVEKQGEDHGAADLCQNEGEKVDTVGTDDVAQHVRDRGADGSHDWAEDHCA